MAFSWCICLKQQHTSLLSDALRSQKKEDTSGFTVCCRKLPHLTYVIEGHIKEISDFGKKKVWWKKANWDAAGKTSASVVHSTRKHTNAAKHLRASGIRNVQKWNRWHCCDSAPVFIFTGSQAVDERATDCEAWMKQLPISQYKMT